MKLYNLAYYVGMAWFAGFVFWAALQPSNQNAGLPTFMIILGIAAAPCALLWTARRIKTGQWIS